MKAEDQQETGESNTSRVGDPSTYNPMTEREQALVRRDIFAESKANAAEDNPAEIRCYRIIRFRFNGRSRVIRNNVTLEEAQAHCSREDTSSHSTGDGAWFDGYDYMKGCKTRMRIDL